MAVLAIVVELLIGFWLGNSVLPFTAIKPLSGLTELGVLAPGPWLALMLPWRAALISRQGWSPRLVPRASRQHSEKR